VENVLGAFSLAVSDRLAAATEEAAGASASAPAALSTLLTYGGREISIDRLRTIIGLSHSATVRLVDRLSGVGLVERRRGADGRELSLRLTSRGRGVARRVHRERAELLSSLLSPLDARQRRELEALLAPLVAKLVAGRREARNICRLCDHGACERASGCPVDSAATALGE
jgi:MarR family transcriptional regulator, negative regulator of the multidrug operon emrRAB